jgi:hypothetical protein
MSHKCHLHEYTCHLHLTRIRIDNLGLMNITFHFNETINITINHPSAFTQRISYEQAIKPTNFIDYISEQVLVKISSIYRFKIKY